MIHKQSSVLTASHPHAKYYKLVSVWMTDSTGSEPPPPPPTPQRGRRLQRWYLQILIGEEVMEWQRRPSFIFTVRTSPAGGSNLKHPSLASCRALLRRFCGDSKPNVICNPSSMLKHLLGVRNTFMGRYIVYHMTSTFKIKEHQF